MIEESGIRKYIHMENLNKPNINLEPIYTFLTEDTSPIAFAKLLDELIFHYMTLLIRMQLSEFEDKTIHQQTDEFLFYIKTLRDILPLCEKK